MKTTPLAGLFAAAIPLSLIVPASLAHAAPANVEYTVLGSGNVSVKYTGGNGENQVEEHATLPWTTAITFTKSTHISFTVTAPGMTDSLTCIIYVNKTEVAAVSQQQPLTCEADIQVD